jgi:CheY-like chemotaxis protein
MAKRILVIEDQEDNRRILRDLLAGVGYLHQICIGGEVRRLKQSSENATTFTCC